MVCLLNARFKSQSLPIHVLYISNLYIFYPIYAQIKKCSKSHGYGIKCDPH